jgi:hypothetical protein
MVCGIAKLARKSTILLWLPEWFISAHDKENQENNNDRRIDWRSQLNELEEEMILRRNSIFQVEIDNILASKSRLENEVQQLTERLEDANNKLNPDLSALSEEQLQAIIMQCIDTCSRIKAVMDEVIIVQWYLTIVEKERKKKG